jgi:hypothetical protein
MIFELSNPFCVQQSSFYRAAAGMPFVEAHFVDSMVDYF